MTEAEIAAAAALYPAHHVVITGGEPALQLTASLVDALHAAGKFVAVETNGTRPLPCNVDWVTLSPKDALTAHAALALTQCNELKVIFTEKGINAYADIKTAHRFVQPCDTGNEARNALLIKQCIAWCKAHPEWRLSLQTHKITGIR